MFKKPKRLKPIKRYVCEPSVGASFVVSFTDIARIVCEPAFTKRYGVRPSVCPSMAHIPAAANPPLQVCCCGPGGQETSNDCCSSGVRRANAGSATLSAYVDSYGHRLVICIRSANRWEWAEGNMFSSGPSVCACI